MKIIYVIEDFSIKGGAERIISEKANFLESNYEHEVTIVSIYHDERPQSYELNKNIKLISLDVNFTDNKGSFIKRNINRTATLLTTIKRFNKVVNDIKPDIIFFTMIIGALILPFCKTKAKRVYESHLARPFTLYQKMFIFMERKADTIVCLTQEDAMNYRKAKDVCIIPNFIKDISLHVKDYSIKRAIAVGRLEHQKGFDMLIDCWKEVAKAHPDWQLDIYGEGSLHEELQRQITRCGLEGRVVLRGRCENMTEAYTGHSLHIMSSRYEGQPMTLIEAQACGLPSVVFNFNYGAKDIVSNGYNGIIVPQNDLNALSGAIVQMAGDEALRAKYGANARLTADRFNRDRIMEKWRQLINRLCAE